jgi:hypothetical protein
MAGIVVLATVLLGLVAFAFWSWRKNRRGPHERRADFERSVAHKQPGTGWYVLPRTRAGSCAAVLVGVFALSLVIMAGVNRDWTVGSVNVWGSFNFAVVIAGSALALYAVLRQGERSLLALIPILLAFLAVGLELAEFFFPSD